jgi:CubicO group peptidase (beta-lactamase class C family)
MKIRLITAICLLLTVTSTTLLYGQDAARSVGKPLSAQYEAMDAALAEIAAPLHSVLVAKGEAIVFERYWTGEDQPWGKARGTYVYGAEKLHDMRSISKSVVSLLVGIAVDRGQIDIEKSPFDYLPEYADLVTPQKAKIKMRNLLSMDAGFVSNEVVAYDDPNNTERLMNIAEDPARYALARNALHEPGANWDYDGGSTMVLARILQKLSGKDLLTLARIELFEPLGIKNVDWIRLRKSGEFAAQGGLRLLPRDLVKIGELVLNDGRWGKRTLVSAGWLRRSATPVHDAWYTERYGLHWWSGSTVLPDERSVSWTEGLGVGGQRLYIVPDLDMVVVITAGLYGRADQGAIVRRVFENAIALYGTH